MEQGVVEDRLWAPSERQERLITRFSQYIGKAVPSEAWKSYRSWRAFFEENLTRIHWDDANTVAVDYGKPHPRDFAEVVGLLLYEQEILRRCGSRLEARLEEARKLLRQCMPLPDVEELFSYEIDQQRLRKVVQEVEREGYLVSYDGEFVG